jgi:DNA-binding MarR family transcriptional regulator
MDRTRQLIVQQAASAHNRLRWAIPLSQRYLDDVRDDDMAAELARTVAGLHRAARQRTREQMPDPALPTAQGELLAVVGRRPGLRVAAAAQELHLADNSVSTLVNALVETGLLDRRPDPDDRRAARLTLTPAGEKRIATWHGARADQVGRALRRVDPADRVALAAALPALRRLLEALREGGDRD